MAPVARGYVNRRVERYEHRGHATPAQRCEAPQLRNEPTWRAIDAAPTRHGVRVDAIKVALLCVLALSAGAAGAASLSDDLARENSSAPTVAAADGSGGAAVFPADGADPFAYAVSLEGRPLGPADQGAWLDIDGEHPAPTPAPAASPGPHARVGPRTAVTLGLTLGTAGAAVWFVAALIRRTRLLAHNPWIVMPASVVDLPDARGGGRSRYLLLDDPTCDPVTAKAVGLRHIVDAMAPHAWVAGGGDRFVVAPPGGAPVVAVRRVHSPR